MNYDISSLLVFFYLCLANGLSAAAISKSLKNFEPTLLIAIRMFSGFFICLIILLIKIPFNIELRTNLKKKLFPDLISIVHVCISGMLFQGIPHTLYAFAQQWVSSSMAQLMRPLSPIMGTVFSHFFLPDEKFNLKKFFSLLFAVIGVSMTSIPSFSDSHSTYSLSNRIFGFILLFFAVSFTGIALVYMKKKTKHIDSSISAVYQMFSSGFFCLIWYSFKDGKHIFDFQKYYQPFKVWIYPILTGIFASGLTVHGSLYLVEKVGAVGTSFTKFGQIIIGVGAGIIWLNEWAKYSKFDIYISIGGIIILSFGILIEFIKFDEKKKLNDNLKDQLLLLQTNEISIIDEYTESNTLIIK